MRLVKQGGHRLFTQDPETVRVVSEMLSDIEKHGLDAVRKYSRQFDDCAPERFELSERQIRAAISSLDPQIIEDTDFCQSAEEEICSKNQLQ